MRTYVIQSTALPLPALTDVVFDPDTEPFCKSLAFAPIDRYAWGGDYRPEARAYAGRDEVGLKVLLCANEPKVSARVRDFGGAVWTDSCLEFFFRPFADDPRYVNIEVNAAGAALIAVGPDRDHREKLETCPAGMDIRASRHEGGWWAVAYAVPFALVEALFARQWQPCAAFRGNFYTCDESIHPHFGSWSPIDAPAPDFHRPEAFGKLLFQRNRTDSVV